MAIKERIRVTAIIFMLMFLLPIGSLTYFQIIDAPKLDHSQTNYRQQEEVSLRGCILDRRGKVLARSKGGERLYPLAEATAPLVGYYTARFGNSGCEDFFKDMTKGYRIPRSAPQAVNIIEKGSRQGDDVNLTLDADLQQFAYETLAGYRGACVVMDVDSGELLALASRPSYNPNPQELEADWQKIITNPSAPLIERCTQGLYPPGSTFKVLVMAGALEDGLTKPEESFYCQGKMNIGNFVLNCNSRHDRVNLDEALAYSCNMAFAEIGIRMGREGIISWMKRFGLEDKMPLVPGSAKAGLPADGDFGCQAAEAAMGQADVMVSPLHMARVAACVARGGLDLSPRLLLCKSRRGESFWCPPSESPCRVFSEANAAIVTKAMEDTVIFGTGTRAALPGVQVAAKTGSAENPHGNTHAWFIGFAPADNPQVAVAVILENAGGGGKMAAPVARRVLEKALKH